MERRLAAWPGLRGGMTRCRVFSFHHLAREAFLRAGGAPGRQLGDIGRVMLLRQAMRRRQGALAALGQSATQPGVAETISQSLLELQRYGWDRADLDAWLAAAALAGDGQSLTSRKVRDLSLLWRDYEDALASGNWEDPARTFELAADAIRRAHWLEGCRIWVDGFATFTAQEMKILDALLEKAGQASIALCLDPALLRLKQQAGGRLRPRLGAERMFENIDETYHMLRQRLRDLGLPDDRVRVVELPAKNQPTRFSSAPALAHLESRVLGRMHPAPFPDEAWSNNIHAPQEPAPAPPIGPIGPIGPISPMRPIELLEASDRRAEIEAIARRIVTLCRREASPSSADAHPTLLWRDVAVLTRDLRPYEVHLREVFAAFKIPFFLDRPRAVEGHPLARSILTALGVLRSGWAGDAVLHHLKSGLCGLNDEDGVGILENAIRATDPRGSSWMRWIEQSEQLRPLWRQAAAPLRQLETDLKTETGPRALWAYLEKIQAPARLEAWISDAREAGDEETVQIHEQAWEQTVSWLEEFEKIQEALPAMFDHAPERPAWDRAQELLDLVEAALASTQARLIPPTLNQVTVGSVDRSRTPEVKTLFVIGLNDGELPRMWQPEAMLGDEERGELTRHGRALGPDSQRKRLQEHFLAYIALTRPSERLILSRPQVDDEGRVCDPSPYYILVAQQFPHAPVQAVKRAGEGDAALPLRPEEWALRCSLALGRAFSAATDGLHEALAAGEALLEHPDLEATRREALRLSRARFAPPSPAALDPALALAYWQDGALLPVTALESYGECPYKFFAGRMLRLTQRQEAMLNVQDLGTLRHGILDRLFRALRKDKTQGLDWGTVDPAEADAAIDRIVVELRLDKQWAARLEASALGGMTVEEVAGEIKLFVRALGVVGRRGRFIQIRSEWIFGKNGEYTIQAGPRRFSIRGTIDRIDALPRANGEPPTGLLIDYKSGRRTLSLARIMEGIDMQLLTYALAWRQACEDNGARGARVGGVFYWPLAAPVREADAQDGAEGEAVDAGWFARQKPSGIFAADLADFLDCEVAPETGALVFGFRKTKTGALHGAGQSHWPREDFEELLRYEEMILERWSSMIVQGRIAINPFLLGKAMACDLCDYGALCRKADPVELAFRRIAGLKRDGAIERLRGEG